MGDHGVPSSLGCPRLASALPFLVLLNLSCVFSAESRGISERFGQFHGAPAEKPKIRVDRLEDCRFWGGRNWVLEREDFSVLASQYLCPVKRPNSQLGILFGGFG